MTLTIRGAMSHVTTHATTHATTPDEIFRTEGENMTATTYATPAIRGEKMKISLLFSALFPFFLVAAGVSRALAISGDRSTAGKSLVGESWENLSIAISYALMARAMLQSFARD